MSAPKPSQFDPAYVSEISLDQASRALAAGRTDEAARLARATHGLHLALRSRPEWEWTVERRLGVLETRLDGAMERLHARIERDKPRGRAGPQASLAGAVLRPPPG